MKAIEILRNCFLLPNFPWGVDVFKGLTLKETSNVKESEFFDVTHHFDNDKTYFVVWNRILLCDFIEKMPPHDLLIKNGLSKIYCWEIEN